MKRQKNKKVAVDATVVWKALKPCIMVLCADTTITEKRGYDRNAEKRKSLDE